MISLIKRLYSILLFSFILVNVSRGQPVLYEDFNYAPETYIGGNGIEKSSSKNWTTHSVTEGETTTINIISGSLSYSGLPTSSGNRILLFSNANATSRDVNREFTSSSTVLYYSALINILDSSQITTAGDYFMHFGSTSGSTITVFGALLGVKSVNSGSNFRFSILNTNGGTSPRFTEFTTDLNFRTTYLIVVKYNRSTNPTKAYLWVNPANLGGSEPGGFVSNASGKGSFPAFASICLRNSESTPKAEIDEIRVAATWGDVTFPTGALTPPLINPED